MRKISKLGVMNNRFSKAILGIFLAAVVLIPAVSFCLEVKAYEDYTGIQVDKKLLDCFPDRTFAEFVLREVLNEENGNIDNYRLVEQDINKIHNLKVIFTSDIKDCYTLKGIENFTSLMELSCFGCYNLTAVDVSKCTHLEKLSFNSSSITTINVSNLQKLKSVDIADCPNIEFFNGANSGINDARSICMCHNLKYLNLANTKIDYLDVTNCSDLEYLNCSSTNIENLYVLGCIKLRSIDCYDTEIKSINLSTCISLLYLNCPKSVINNLTNTTNCINLINIIHD